VIVRPVGEHPFIVRASFLDRALRVAAVALLAGCGSSSNEPPVRPSCPRDAAAAGASGQGGGAGGAGGGAAAPDGASGASAPDAGAADVPSDGPSSDEPSRDAPAGDAPVSDALATSDGGDARVQVHLAACPTPPADERVLQVAVGGGRSCAVLSGGVLKCWGPGGGQLGLGNTAGYGSTPHTMGANLPAVDLGAGRVAVSVSLGAFHTCVLLAGGDVKCFGNNYYGQLGYDDTSARGDGPNQMGDKLPVVDLGTGKKAASVCAGYAYSCAVLTDGSLKCWGANGPGALGYGDRMDRGAMAGQMGDNLPAVDLGTGRTALAVSCGVGSDPYYEHTCAILDDHSLKCWGSNYGGELGLGDRTARGYKPGQMGDNLPPVDLGTGQLALSVSTGYGFTCALLASHQVKCWGEGEYLGLGRTDSRGAEPGQMGDALPAVDLGTGKQAVAMRGGSATTCAILSDGTLKCWGGNGGGALGLGDNLPRGTLPRQMGDNLPAVDLGICLPVSLALGNSYGGSVATCVLVENGLLKCFGYGSLLGYEDTVTRGDEPGEMGDNLPFVKLFSDAW
jgi:alpha-tubulin suppressor-like RCC1 family protein